METTNDGPFGGAEKDGKEEEEKKKVDEKERFVQKPLPERVCELFLMQDLNGGGTESSPPPFFRSPFMRDRLPQMLFSNGANGLNGGGGGGGGWMVRNIPIKVVNAADWKPRDTTAHSSGLKGAGGGGGGGGMEGGNTMEMERPNREMAEELGLMSSPELRRHFASLFWTPQQARRIAEREQQGQEGNGQKGGDDEEADDGRLGRGFGGGSSVTVYSIPISTSTEPIGGEMRRQRWLENGRGKSQKQQPEGEGGGGGGPYSAIPFRRRAGMNSALSTPSLFPADPTSSPIREKPPLAPSSTPSRANKPTSFPANQPSSQPILRRTQTTFSLPHQELPRRDSEPTIVLAENDQKRLRNAASGAPLERPIHSHQQCPHLSVSSEDSGSVSSSSSSRSKSPSLASLRQSLLRLRPSRKGLSASSSSYSLLPVCIRSRQSSGSDQEESNERAATASASKKNGGGGNGSLAASTLRLTEFVSRPERNGGGGRRGHFDAVEEAIRSLEQFDPSDFVHRQYHQGGRPSFQQKNRSQGGGAPPRVFLAKAEPVPIRQPLSTSSAGPSSLLFSSLPSERRSSSLSFSSSSLSSEDPSPSPPPPPHPPPPSALHFPRRPSTTTISSGSATPTQPVAHSTVDGSTMFGHSMDHLETPRANSPTQNGGVGGARGLPEMDQLISRLKGGGPQRRGVTFNEQPPTQHLYSPFDGPPPDYSESGGSDDEEGTGGEEEDMDMEERGHSGEKGDSEQIVNAAALEAEAQLRKRFLCSQLTDCAKVIEINALKMGQFVATGTGLGGWRQPHILRHNLGAIRDTIYTVEFALDELVESLGRVSLDPRDPRRVHLRQLAQPIQTSLAMLRKLRVSLDSTSWSLSSLSRSRGAFAASHGHQQDALDQLVAILPQLPKDCQKLVQWIYSLSVWPDPHGGDRLAAAFLPASACSSTSFLPPILHPPPPPPAPVANGHGQPRPPSPTSSLQNYYSSGDEEPRKKAKGGVAEVMDGGESTSSTTSSLQTMEREGEKGEEEEEPKGRGDDGLVLEEDDLASVVSDTTDHHFGGPQHFPSPHHHHRRVNAELSRSLSPDQRDLFRLYEPQVAGYIAAMCSLIEEFFSLVESNKEPKLSFQKIQMIYIEGHSLCGIIRVLCRDDSISQHRPLNAFLDHECAKLDSLLNECLAAAKVAKTKQAQNWTRAQQHSVPAVQSMCQAVVSLSECANQMRTFWRSCAG